MTSTVYGLIRKQDYGEAARVLVIQLQQFPRSRAGLSLLGYCYYQMQDFRSAAQTYEQLCTFYPGVESYSLYYAQSLHKAGLYQDASRAASRVESEEHEQRVRLLQASIK